MTERRFQSEENPLHNTHRYPLRLDDLENCGKLLHILREQRKTKNDAEDGVSSGVVRLHFCS